MGCITSVHQKGGAADATRKRNGVLSGKSSRTPSLEVVAPDPDLGWRQVPGALVLSVSAGVASGAVQTNLQDWVSSTTPTGDPGGRSRHVAAPTAYPLGWIVYFFNDRSGQFCHVSLLTLAINISIRAARLAESFGVLSSESVSGEQQQGEPPPESRTRRAIYAALGIPDFSWELVQRVPTSPPPVSDAETVIAGTKRRIVTSSSEVTLQLLKSGSGKRFLADVPTIGMNIAEQLHRLERKQDNRHFLPTETFGWTFEASGPAKFQVAARSPNGDSIVLVPEEMIMNVTQWVQQTYLTSAVF